MQSSKMGFLALCLLSLTSALAYSWEQGGPGPSYRRDGDDLSARVEDLEERIDMLVAGSSPATGPMTGIVVGFSGKSVPEGYLLCDGRAVSRAAYPALFKVVGTLYGAGDGTTTFNLPDLRGRIPVGVDAGAGRISSPNPNSLATFGGEQQHVLSIAEIPSHGHGVSDPGHVHDFSTGTVPLIGPGSSTSWNHYEGDGRGSLTQTGWARTNIAIQGTGGGLGHNNLQPYLILSWIIKS